MIQRTNWHGREGLATGTMYVGPHERLPVIYYPVISTHTVGTPTSVAVRGPRSSTDRPVSC